MMMGSDRYMGRVLTRDDYKTRLGDAYRRRTAEDVALSREIT